jgi:hypothetical protein
MLSFPFSILLIISNLLPILVDLENVSYDIKFRYLVRKCSTAKWQW